MYCMLSQSLGNLQGMCIYATGAYKLCLRISSQSCMFPSLVSQFLKLSFLCVRLCIFACASTPVPKPTNRTIMFYSQVFKKLSISFS